MDEEFLRGAARITSIEAAEFAAGLAEGRAVADEFLQRLRSGDADADALHQLMKRESLNAFVDYRFKGVCARLQEVLRLT